MSPMIVITGAAKTFTMHLQNGVRLPVVSGVSMHVNAGECVVLAGPSGAGKSSILKMIFGNYRCDQGYIAVQHGGEMVDIATAQPREVLRVRRQTIGYVSQFLRAVPRVPALDVVAEPLIANGMPRENARAQAGSFLHRLNIAESCGPAAVDVLRRRAAAREYCARLYLGHADPAARRTDGIAGCCQSQDRG